jgi:hypothetical protein
MQGTRSFFRQWFRVVPEQVLRHERKNTTWIIEKLGIEQLKQFLLCDKKVFTA